MRAISPKIAPSYGWFGPPSNTWYLGSSRVLNPNDMSSGSPVFCATHSKVSLYFRMGHSPPPSKLLLHMGDVDPYVIHGSLSPPESSTQTASWLVQPFLQGSLVWQTDRQTTLLGSVTIGRICVCSTVMRPNKNMNCKNVQFTSKYKHRVTTLKKQISLLWVSTQSVKLNFACKVMLQILLTLHCHC